VPSLVSIDEIRAAAARLDGVAFRTPLVPFPGADPRLLLKAESLQPTGSFKLRGAYAAISALPAEVRARGVVAHSSGNHAGAVAYAAALLGVSATVVVPDNAPPVKLDPVRRLGARIVVTQPSLTARVAATEDLVRRHRPGPRPGRRPRPAAARAGPAGERGGQLRPALAPARRDVRGTGEPVPHAARTDRRGHQSRRRPVVLLQRIRFRMLRR